MNQQRSSWSRTAAPGEVIYSEGFAGDAAIFVIADGKVEISTYATKRRSSSPPWARANFSAKQPCCLPNPEPHRESTELCQLTVIAANVVEEELERVSPLLRHIVRTMIRRVKRRMTSLRLTRTLISCRASFHTHTFWR